MTAISRRHSGIRHNRCDLYPRLVVVPMRGRTSHDHIARQVRRAGGKFMTAHLRAFWKNEEGQGLIEYGLLVALIALVCVGALTTTGTKVNDIFEAIRDKMPVPAP
jgi:pilus assembly protein Flp/PilA